MKIIKFIVFGFILSLLVSCSRDTSDFIEIIPGNGEDSGVYLMNFNNYLGNPENIHPKVLFFEDGWNGYEFWMAYTPYPKGATDAENPCIAVSHDGIRWETPTGLLNPLEPTPEDGYNSDTHLVYDKENDQMELWWRPYYNPTNQDAVCRRISTDGINWSKKEFVIGYSDFQEMILSPTVWIDHDVYNLVYSNGKELKLITSPKSSIMKWSEPLILPIEWGDLRAWHQDIIINPDGDWEIVVCAYGPEGNNNTADLYYLKYNPQLQKSTMPTLIVSRGFLGKKIDDRSIYRSSLVKVKNSYYLYYSSIDHSWSRHMILIKNCLSL